MTQDSPSQAYSELCRLPYDVLTSKRRVSCAMRGEQWPFAVSGEDCSGREKHIVPSAEPSIYILFYSIAKFDDLLCCTQ